MKGEDFTLKVVNEIDEDKFDILNYKYLRSLLGTLLSSDSNNIYILKNKDNKTHTIYKTIKAYIGIEEYEYTSKLSYTVDTEGTTKYYYDLLSLTEALNIFTIVNHLGYYAEIISTEKIKEINLIEEKKIKEISNDKYNDIELLYSKLNYMY